MRSLGGWERLEVQPGAQVGGLQSPPGGGTGESGVGELEQACRPEGQLSWVSRVEADTVATARWRAHELTS